MLAHCQCIWPDLNLVDDLSLDDGLMFCGHRVAKALNYIRKDGIRYGCATNKKSHVNCFAFVCFNAGSQTPVQIESLFLLEVNNKPLQVVALIQRLVSDVTMPTFPWDL